MAKFKANIRFKDLEKNVIHEAHKEFEMTIERSKELVKNIKNNHGVDIILTRLDKEEAPKVEVETKDEKVADEKTATDAETKAKAEPKEKEPEGDK